MSSANRLRADPDIVNSRAGSGFSILRGTDVATKVLGANAMACFGLGGGGESGLLSRPVDFRMADVYVKGPGVAFSVSGSPSLGQRPTRGWVLGHVEPVIAKMRSSFVCTACNGGNTSRMSCSRE